MEHISTTIRKTTAITIMLALATSVQGQRNRHLLMNEQETIQVRQHAANTIPNPSVPNTVADSAELPVWELSLDEAIRMAMQNTDAVRVLSGVGAASSGQTIYSPAISNTGIDRARAEFDPTLSAQNTFLRNESPVPFLEDPLNPANSRTLLGGRRSDNYDFAFGANKRFLNGANAAMRVGVQRTRLGADGAALNPQSNSDVDITLTQPLLQGRGVNANAVPTVLAFIDTERSYFRLKQGLQRTVEGVIQGYWDLVQARTELWVLEQQIRASEWANKFNEDSLEFGRADLGVVAQSRASLANFRASLITSKANILNRIASLRGIMGMPPGSDFTIVPVSKPFTDRLAMDWETLLALAETNRPDLIELQLVLEADEQRILLAQNQAQPRLDAVGLYRWNGLEGQMPIGDRLVADPGDFTDWSLAVNFSVPLTLRAERANLRQNELLLASDRVNLRQRLLEVSHELAFTVRQIEQLYEQYAAFQEARKAAKISLDAQVANYLAQRTTFLDFLLAVNTWANSVTSEARSVTQLNATLATLEFQTGTILDSHGIRLFEERYCSLGPMGPCVSGSHVSFGRAPE